jgi:L-lactate dehydrogenase complex protein LldF
MDQEHIAMKIMGRIFKSRSRYEKAQKRARTGQKLFVKNGTISKLPGELSGWTAMRDIKPISNQTFREWWEQRNE